MNDVSLVEPVQEKRGEVDLYFLFEREANSLRSDSNPVLKQHWWELGLK